MCGRQRPEHRRHRPENLRRVYDISLLLTSDDYLQYQISGRQNHISRYLLSPTHRCVLVLIGPVDGIHLCPIFCVLKQQRAFRLVFRSHNGEKTILWVGDQPRTAKLASTTASNHPRPLALIMLMLTLSSCSILDFLLRSLDCTERLTRSDQSERNKQKAFEHVKPPRYPPPPPHQRHNNQ